MAETLNWSFGLRNASGKYLTAETFGFRINANGNSLKKKQIFYLEQDAGSEKVYIRTSLGRYLTTTAAGGFSGDAETKGPNELFSIEAQDDGRWLFKGAHGYYAGGSGEKLDAYTKTKDADRFWVIQLAMHPQCNVRNINRKRYVHLTGDSFSTDEDIPWGDDALITLVFFEEGKYGLQASNGQYLAASGALKNNPDADTRFTLVFFSDQLAFKSVNNTYLTALGARGTLKATKDSVNKDELFVLEDSQPQLKLLAKNGKRVSVRAGVEVSANQDTATDAEFFQIEINRQTKQWSFRTHKNNFWSVGDDGAISAGTSTRGEREWFTIEWLGAQIAIKASNGKYITIKGNGGLVATATSSSEGLYIWEIINRPRLILRGPEGFVGTLPSGVLECNKSIPEEYLMHVSKGVAHISGSNGKYWKVNDNNITVDGAQPQDFFLELVEHSKFLIKATNGKYIQGHQNGSFTATGTSADASTLWEY